MDPIFSKILFFYHRFLYASSLWNTQKEELDKCLSDYFIQTPESTDTKKLVKHYQYGQPIQKTAVYTTVFHIQLPLY